MLLHASIKAALTILSSDITSTEFEKCSFEGTTLFIFSVGGECNGVEVLNSSWFEVEES